MNYFKVKDYFCSAFWKLRWEIKVVSSGCH